LSGEIRYYKGLHKVKVVTESQGYWTVEALEEFEECVDGCMVKVKVGEQRIVPPNLVHKQKNLPPMVKEHAYELQMEKKLKQMVAKEEKKEDKDKTPKKPESRT
jgi:Leu/Phe-tRNA-protein transferase